MNDKSIFRDISLASMFMAMTVITNLVTTLFPIVLGFPISFYLVILALGLIILKTFIVKHFFLFFTPFVLLVAPNVYWINIWQVILEYFVANWCFYPLIFSSLFIKKINKNNNKILEKLFFSLLFIFCLMLKLLIHTIAGYFWWTDQNWVGSFLINLPIIGTDILLVIPTFILIYSKIIQLSKTCYLNIWNTNNL